VQGHIKGLVQIASTGLSWENIAMFMADWAVHAVVSVGRQHRKYSVSRGGRAVGCAAAVQCTGASFQCKALWDSQPSLQCAACHAMLRCIPNAAVLPPQHVTLLD
jgi:hypothetical protein